MFHGDRDETLEGKCASLIQSLPLLYSSLEHQKGDVWCRVILDRVLANQIHGGNFQVFRNLLCYIKKSAKRRGWVVPSSMRTMLHNYFHDTELSGHLGARKKLSKIAANFYLRILNGPSPDQSAATSPFCSYLTRSLNSWYFAQK